MDHPNIAKVFDAGETESGRSYFVMELVRGIPLTDYCDQNELTTRERLELFVQVCQAVQHAHQKGIIHRDLKPSNVMVTLYDGVPVPKIIDFGIAKATDGQLTERAVSTNYGQIIGTPLYMSPEQAEMSGLDVDPRSDIYSLGVMLYELLTGNTPFDGERVREAGYDEIRRMIREDEPPRPSDRISTLRQADATATVAANRKTDPAKLSSLLRRDLDWIVMKALEKDRTRRYQTASDFAQDIQHYLNDEPIEARRPTVRDRLVKWARRHRTIVWSAATSVFGAAAAIFMGIVFLVSTGKGTVKLEFADAEAARQCTVSIDGDEIRIENLGEPIKLRPGKHQLRILHGGLEIETREFDVVRHGAQVLHVSIPGVAKPEPPWTAEGFAARGRAFVDNESWDLAVDAYTEAIHLQPNVAEYHAARGEAYWVRSGRVTLAMADFNEAIRLDPTRADPWFNRGTLHYHFAYDLAKADSDFRQALRIDPDCVRRLFERAEKRSRAMQRRHAHTDVGIASAIQCVLGESDKRNLDQVISQGRDLLRLKNELTPMWVHWVSWWLPTVVRGKDKLPGVVFVSDMPWVRSTNGWGSPTAIRNTKWGGPVLLGDLPYWKGIVTNAFPDERPADVVVDISGRRFASLRTHVGTDGPHGSERYQVLVDGKLKHETLVLRFGTVESISVDVAGGKEIILRVLNGGAGNNDAAASWGFARFIQAGAEDPLEVPPAELQSATDANAALFLAEVHWRLDHKNLARRWFDKAAAWMGKNKTEPERLRQYRTEAAQLLGVPEKASTAKDNPQKPK